jgi:hypothetical protein
VLSLPSKRWKRVTLTPAGEGMYTVTVVSPLRGEEDFHRVVREDVEVSLGDGERLLEARWATRSIVVAVADLALFKRRLAFRNVLVDVREA